MATSMWRMNGLCRKMTGLLGLCTLLLSSVVICQDATSASPTATATQSLHNNDDKAPEGSTASSEMPGVTNTASAADELRTTTATMIKENINNIVPEINAYTVAEKEAISSNVGKSESESSETPSSSDSSVFVGVLVSGLLAALGITAGYLYCQRRSTSKGMKLTDKAFPEDQENQGSTLASVAPLNPPPETQEKPSVNGESPEAAKTQPPPPTNGHSATKTADTEM